MVAQLGAARRSRHSMFTVLNVDAMRDARFVSFDNTPSTLIGSDELTSAAGGSDVRLESTAMVLVYDSSCLNLDLPPATYA